MPDQKRGPDGEEGAAQETPEFVEACVLPNSGVVAVAKSLLEAAGIGFFIKNEGTQSLFGWGQVGTGYSVITGPPTLMVEAQKVLEARELLGPLLEPGREPAAGQGADVRLGDDADVDDDADVEKSDRGRARILIELAAVLLVTCVYPILSLLLHRGEAEPIAAAWLEAEIPWHLGLTLIVWLLLVRDPTYQPPLPKSAGGWVRDVAIGVVLFWVMWEVERVLGVDLEIFGVPRDSSPWTVAFRDPAVIAVYPFYAVFSAASQEIVFRSYLLERLTLVLGGSTAAALVVSGALFALVHGFGAANAVTLFVAGLLYGLAYLWTRSLPCLVVAHLAHNLFSMYSTLHPVLRPLRSVIEGALVIGLALVLWKRRFQKP